MNPPPPPPPSRHTPRTRHKLLECRLRRPRKGSLADENAGRAHLSEIKSDALLRLRAPDTTRKTKIVCAIGPSCDSVEMLGKLIDAGMNVARLNFSHRTLEYHAQSLQNLREALRARPHKQCAVLMDTKVRPPSLPPPTPISPS